ncbi:MAG: anthranilate synthase component I [Ruminiclostridium sp.]|nr:anthranilate synthase component I [Ruminiclostridium sp.]
MMDYEKVVELSKKCNFIPICREVYSDLTTPVSLLKKLEERSSRFFLLESVEDGKNWGRYSFLGLSPNMRVTCKNDLISIFRDEKTLQIPTQKPFVILRQILEEYKVPKLENMPPFTGGLVGFFAYSMFRYKERKLKLRESEFNDFDLMLFTDVIVFDHLKQKVFIIVNISTDNLKKNYRKANEQIDAIESIIRATPVPEVQFDNLPTSFQCNMSREDYCEVVEKTKKYIYDGDIFQAVLSRKFKATMKGSLVNAYRVLRTTNPSPYMVYLKIDDLDLMCSSPETLVRLRDGCLTTFPIAGSRPRGKTKQEDELLEKELLSDEKELSEHNMLVDLGRNDLGMISEIGSVRVTEYMTIHRYSKIMHICSRVESKIVPGHDALDAIEAILPAGTLSGAPKIRACEIIEELEAEPRGIYGGALGYIDFTGNMDTCIAIRMAVKKGDTVHIQAGGGIVADSVGEMEFEESGNKASAVMNAVLRAKEVDDI